MTVLAVSSWTGCASPRTAPIWGALSTSRSAASCWASVIIRKLAQNIAMTTGYPALAVVMVLAVLASAAILMPGRIRWRRLAALDLEHPASYWVRVALVVGAWVGYGQRHCLC